MPKIIKSFHNYDTVPSCSATPRPRSRPNHTLSRQEHAYTGNWIIGHEMDYRALFYPYIVPRSHPNRTKYQGLPRTRGISHQDLTKIIPR